MLALVIEETFGDKKLKKTLDRREFFFFIFIPVFITSVLISNNGVAFVGALGWVLNVCVCMFFIEQSDADEAQLKWLIKLDRIYMSILIISSSIGVCVGYCEVLNKGFNNLYIPSYIFLFLNLLYVFNLKSENFCAKNALKRLQNKSEKKERYDNASVRIEDTLSTVRHMFYGLEDKDMSILRPCILKIQDLFMLSYDNSLNITNLEIFCNTEDFLKHYANAIKTYKKGKDVFDGVFDLDFLVKLNNSAEEFYDSLNGKKQGSKKREFDEAIRILKIKKDLIGF